MQRKHLIAMSLALGAGLLAHEAVMAQAIDKK